MRGSRKLFQRVSSGPTLTLFYLYCSVNEGEKIQLQCSTKSGPSSALQSNVISMAFRPRTHDGPTLNAGLVALWFFMRSEPVLIKRHCIFVLLSRVSGPHAPTPHSVHVLALDWKWSIHLRQMELPTLINRTSPFQILGVLCVFFLFLFKFKYNIM